MVPSILWVEVGGVGSSLIKDELKAGMFLICLL